MADGLDRHHLDELISLEETYWWHVAKRRLVLDLLRRYFPPPGRIVEGGIGAGGNLLACRDLGYDVVGFDLMPDAVATVRLRGLATVETLDLEQQWPVEPNSAAAVLLLDVIEHVDRPELVLQHAAGTLRPGGGVIVTVPAGPWLMGPWDVALGHRRRYTRRLLVEHAAAAGLRVAWASHWNAFSLPPALVVRLLQRLRGGVHNTEFPRVARPINAALKGCAAIERAVLRVAPIPFGLSIVGVLNR